MKGKVEIKAQKNETRENCFYFPPFALCACCVKRLSDKCMEDCAPARDYRHFELRKGVELADLPRFPLDEFLEEMPPYVRQVVVAVYLAKVSDYLRGE